MALSRIARVVGIAALSATLAGCVATLVPQAENFEPTAWWQESPSHGRHYFQEKHGYAGPVEIPWPAHESQ